MARSPPPGIEGRRPGGRGPPPGPERPACPAAGGRRRRHSRRRAPGQPCQCALAARRRVVLADEEHRDPPGGGEVQRLVDDPLAHRSVAEAGDDDARRAATALGQAQPRAERGSAPQHRAGIGHAPTGIGEVQGPGPAPLRSAVAPEQLAVQKLEVGAQRGEVPVISVTEHDHVIRRAHAGQRRGGGFHADRDVKDARDQTRLVDERLVEAPWRGAAAPAADPRGRSRPTAPESFHGGSGAAEEDLVDVGALQQHGGPVLEHHLPGRQHVRPVRDRQRVARMLLDQQDPPPPSTASRVTCSCSSSCASCGESPAVGSSRTSRLGTRHEHAAHREHLALAAAEVAGRGDRASPPAPGKTSITSATRAATSRRAERVAAHLQVLLHGERLEHVPDLRHVADPACARSGRSAGRRCSRRRA